MTLDQGAWQVVELSAKPNGSEWGERVAQGKQHMLAFLFVAPEKAPHNPTSCRDEMLKAEHADGLTPIIETLRNCTTPSERMSYK